MEQKRSSDEIYKWVDTIGDLIPFSRPKKNFARDFSDGVLVAELLKYFYPRFVDLHNYPSANALSLKIKNWTTLDRKVLTKLNLQLTKASTEELAKAHPQAVERLLEKIRDKVEQQDKPLPEDRSFLVDLWPGLSSEVYSVNVGNEKGEPMIKKVVPIKLLEEKWGEIEEKKQEINELKQKVAHMEGIINLKEARIRDLTQQVAKYKNLE